MIDFDQNIIWKALKWNSKRNFGVDTEEACLKQSLAVGPTFYWDDYSWMFVLASQAFKDFC